MKRTIRRVALAAALAMALASALPATAQTFEKFVAALAEEGDVSAQTLLGHMYRVGDGVPQDDAEAARWFRRAAERGDASAQYNLGDMYFDGEGVPRDHAKAAEWYRRAAEQSHASAQFGLGVLLEYGSGVPSDVDEAVKWYHRAAERGNYDAQNKLGRMYSTGGGVPQNLAEAAKWYSRAAGQGNADDQFMLGQWYREGEGIPQDYAEAVKWFRRAAEQGHAKAQAMLGIMYFTGQGLAPDYIRAHMWLNLADSRLPAMDAKYRRAARQIRDHVARLLSPEALARAQRPKADTESSSPPPRAAKGGDDTQAGVAAIQRALARLGYDPGSADGVLGPKTRAAIRAFQADIGLPKDGRLSERLESAVLAALSAAAPEREPARLALERASTGSGFRVSTAGHILTNEHVVRGCAELRVPLAGVVAVAARDEAADLALLEGAAGGAVAAFRHGRGIRAGAGVVVVGYPLRGVLASGANVAAGNVAALAGPGDDRLLIQITAPVQPGNSGGPVLDPAGNAIVVVVSKLDAIAMAQATGDIPQNVNFAVSAGAARAFLNAEGVAYETAPSEKARPPDEVAAAAKRFTVLVECWN